VLGIASNHRLIPRPTLRLRLTLLYGGLFLAAGAVLLAITYELVSHSPSVTSDNTFVVSPRKLPVGVPPPGLRAAQGGGPQVLVGPPGGSAGAAVQLQAYAGQV
jgi:hypothetical protein